MTGVVTLYHPNYQPLADLVLPNLQEYCDKHGYTLLYHCGNYGGGQIGFQKMRYLRDLMRGDLELALVVDLDVIITNLDKRFEDFISGDNDYFVTKDVNGINNGSFIIRKTDWSMHLLKFMLDHESGFTCEQNVLKTLEAQLVNHGLGILPHPSINSYLHPSLGSPFESIYPEWRDTTFPNVWRQGDFLLHLPGMNLEQRLHLLSLKELRPI